MALHSTPASMLKESLDETLEAARLCVTYKKTDSKWGQYSTGGCLGYPSAILLFSIIDSIGSYYRKTLLKVKVDEALTSINSEGWEHFKILNSKYFEQSLSAVFLKSLYNKFRSHLTHNSVLGKDTIMCPGRISYPNAVHSSKAFATLKEDNAEIVYILSLKELFMLCEKAIGMFKEDIDIVVPPSRQGKKFN